MLPAKVQRHAALQRLFLSNPESMTAGAPCLAAQFTSRNSYVFAAKLGHAVCGVRRGESRILARILKDWFRERLRLALCPKLAELPAPVTRLGLEVVELAQKVGRQLELVQPEGLELRAQLSEGLKQVRAGTGSGAVCSVVEVAPWSRIPEQRALLVPRDD